ncbi:MAG: glycoside hydrolase 43 family protein, partial [Planctomycetales bacterium]|nr:glycoside hydrolase 43 family protein [Planctomycetales bacterium]
STTMHMSPGVPIMKSQDLVNWRLIGYAYETLGENAALRLENGENAYGAGSWASSLRRHDGLFYLTTFSSTTGKTHVYATRDIEHGAWMARTFQPMLHDHSLFFDDNGSTYMVYGAGDIRLVELTPDVSGLKPGGLNQVIIKNASRVAGDNVGLPAEGSQLIKVDGKYYLFNITWPRGGMRTVLVHRADKITGPYEGRVALQDRGIAQGCIIDTPQGDWCAYLFRDSGAVGRVPYISPITWEDGWPVIGIDGRVPDELDIPAGDQGASGASGIVASDEFDRAAGDPPLPLAWQWNHNPVGEHWSLKSRPGWLRLTTFRRDSSVIEARNTLTQRTFGPVCSAATAIDVTHMKDGDSAGLVALQRFHGYVGVSMADGKKSIVMVLGGPDGTRVVERAPLEVSAVHLKIECDFRDRADKAYCCYSQDGESWATIGEPLRMRYTLPHFMGYRFGLFNFSSEQPGGFVDFDYYRISGEISDQ